MDKNLLVSALVKADNARARSQQTAIGVSQLGGCSRQVYFKLNGQPETNRGLRLASIMGTAIHSAIEAALADSGAMLETRVEIDGYPPATIDYYDPETKTVVDWKTITLKGVPYFVGKQKRWQIQTYAYLLTLKGYEVEIVKLIGIPRDGSENDIIEHSEPYDEAVALEALAWLDNIKAMPFAPAPEMSGTFCSSYCPFYGEACTGIPKDLAGEAITDEVKAQAASDYVTLSAEIKRLEALQDAAKAELEGVNGVTFDGITVKWSEVAGRKSPALDALKFR
jgi:hypothetical protein